MGVILHVPLFRVHHVYVSNDVRYSVLLYCNVGWCVKGSVLHRNRQQCLVAERLGLSVTVRVRARVRARECFFF